MSSPSKQDNSNPQDGDQTWTSSNPGFTPASTAHAAPTRTIPNHVLLPSFPPLTPDNPLSQVPTAPRPSFSHLALHLSIAPVPPLNAPSTDPTTSGPIPTAQFSDPRAQDLFQGSCPRPIPIPRRLNPEGLELYPGSPPGAPSPIAARHTVERHARLGIFNERPSRPALLPPLPNIGYSQPQSLRERIHNANIANDLSDAFASARLVNLELADRNAELKEALEDSLRGMKDLVVAMEAEVRNSDDLRGKVRGSGEERDELRGRLHEQEAANARLRGLVMRCREMYLNLKRVGESQEASIQRTRRELSDEEDGFWDEDWNEEDGEEFDADEGNEAGNEAGDDSEGDSEHEAADGNEDGDEAEESDRDTQEHEWDMNDEAGEVGDSEWEEVEAESGHEDENGDESRHATRHEARKEAGKKLGKAMRVGKP